ncbi:MAG: major facilitator superfamily domain-containing protein 1 [Bacteroidales bacterium]|nr:major facilitator superfamily domain-containing protein 1 [Bacteroidales bacterium]
MSKVRNTLNNNRWACWLVLACLVVPMFASYFFDDMFSSLSPLFNNPDQLELGWDSADYGFYSSGYSFLCILGGLIVGGVLLDKYGVRRMGSAFVGMMVGGAGLVTYAITAGFEPKTSLTIAYIGCMLFGLGSEIAGVAVTRSIAKWFKGKHTALAMGLQLSIARLGTAMALLIAPMMVTSGAEGHVYTLSETAKPALVGMGVLAVGLILWAAFVAMDSRFDKEAGTTDKVKTAEEDKFRFSDIWKILSNPRFLMIAILCVTFYCCVIRFKKFGSDILIPLFGVEMSISSLLLAMIPFFTIVFTPLFGMLVDKVGKATTWMVTGAGMVLAAHLIITFAPQGEPVFAYISIGLLGIGYSLVPSAMWPSVPKIVPEKNLGTAYSLIYWVQNLGMWSVPILVGNIINNGGSTHAGKVAAALNAEYVFILLGVIAVGVAVMLLRSSRKHPDLRLDDPTN